MIMWLSIREGAEQSNSLDWVCKERAIRPITCYWVYQKLNQSLSQSKDLTSCFQRSVFRFVMVTASCLILFKGKK